MNPGGAQNIRRLDAGAFAGVLELSEQTSFHCGLVHESDGCSINAASSRALMLLSAKAFLQQPPAAMDTPEKIRSWMLGVLERKGWSAFKWATEAGVAASTVQRAIKPGYPFVTSSRTLSRLAAAAGDPTPEVAPLARPQLTPTFLPIRYEVGAGMWRHVDDVSQPYGEAPVAADPAFATFPQWLERVVSGSMDLEYPIGTLLHVVDAAAIGYSVRNGDHVIVERRRNGGGLVERTVKEAVLSGRGLELWGRSTDQRWNKPLAIADGLDDESLEVEIVALVIGSYRARRG